MTYEEWEQAHEIKRDNIVQKLSGLSVEEITDYFSYDNMVKAEPNFCGLYAQNKKCHDMQDLNCYNCGCPYFQYDDKGLSKKGTATVYSKCTINAKESAEFKTEDAIHLDCSNCTIPHTAVAAKKELKE